MRAPRQAAIRESSRENGPARAVTIQMGQRRECETRESRTAARSRRRNRERQDPTKNEQLREISLPRSVIEAENRRLFGPDYRDDAALLVAKIIGDYPD
ncbi:MAG: hypothetical protein K0R44_1336 [Thermomicrobiales bacterium]|nr:hypothetical protein [Thermomicrobiales bacterium]